jgi:hypothetical protein
MRKKGFVLFLCLAVVALFALPALACWDCDGGESGVELGGNYYQNIGINKGTYSPNGGNTSFWGSQGHSAWGHSDGGEGNIQKIMEQGVSWDHDLNGANHFGWLYTGSHSTLGVNPNCPDGNLNMSVVADGNTDTNYDQQGNQHNMNGSSGFYGGIFATGSGNPFDHGATIEAQFGYSHERGDPNDLSNGPYIYQQEINKVFIQNGSPMPTPNP